jgi:light-regulated signal transduction histidine kinase (bacteriophytochrome)
MRGKAGPISDEHKEYLGDVLASSRHLLLLINDVLDLAKVESGKMEFVPERVDIEELADEVRDVVRGLILNRDLAITVDVDPAIGAVEVDPSRTRQILYNYLSNAIKFTPDGGAIRVRVRGEGPEFFRIEVEDSGVGIAADDVAALRRFQQLDPRSSKRYAGTGLGLALTKRIAEARADASTCTTRPAAATRLPSRCPPRRRAGAAEASPRAAGHRLTHGAVIDDDRMSLPGPTRPCVKPASRRSASRIPNRHSRWPSASLAAIVVDLADASPQRLRTRRASCARSSGRNCR